jgi:hypothetical protein
MSEQNDRARFNIYADDVRITSERLIIEFFGERCNDYQQDCSICQHWKALDDLIENPFDE